MPRSSSSHATPQILLGVLIILFGLLLTLDRLGVMDAGELLRYWPALVIVYGASRFFQPPGSRGRTWGGILMLAGTALLIDRLDLFDFQIASLWPVLLILGGAVIVSRAFGRRTERRAGAEAEREDSVNGMAVFGGLERIVSSADFRGGELTAIMGGCDVDLRQCAIRTSPAAIDVFALMGGIKIIVPASWNVEANGFPLFGAIEDKTRHPDDAAAPRLLVRGSAIMGGVEITNT